MSIQKMTSVSHTTRTRRLDLKLIKIFDRIRELNKQLKAPKNNKDELDIKSVVFPLKMALKSRVNPQVGQVMP
ncbi:hypothetical protein [Flavobacterium sp. HSC-61S13]|uniref:hypothetical protein n=1 Tax=Flavobacterium sp. HSC-61S13 TaxID=2910963 RepID=UPI0020A1EBC0|nr:hypothetical protein [Flavobacterium sp. HSC-61S13]MCP1996300.1 hypothetical protein [Flavobacterium sp. HSC-61S13]